MSNSPGGLASPGSVASPGSASSHTSSTSTSSNQPLIMCEQDSMEIDELLQVRAHAKFHVSHAKCHMTYDTGVNVSSCLCPSFFLAKVMSLFI